MALRTSDFDYHLPAECIAQRPLPRRDRSRLMVLRRGDGGEEHRHFDELGSLLRPGDLLVLNDTRVVPARFLCRRQTGAKIEGLFLRETSPAAWEVLLRNAGRCSGGEVLSLDRAPGTELVLREKLPAGRWLLDVRPPAPAQDVLARAGAAPLPPYIRRPDGLGDDDDRRTYQTVYARRPGAVAAPTAGLHFTPELLDGLARRGVDTACLTLHVGPGTFTPVRGEDLERHKMHAEWYELGPEAAEKINAARQAGGRIVAVGTTSVRVLETVRKADSPILAPGRGWTDLFLYPPAVFHAADALITNFHLPRSTLLMLVAAFCSPGETHGVRTILDAYAEAVKRAYRFYSYGDAMLIE